MLTFLHERASLERDMNRERYIHSRARRWLETLLYFGVVGGLLLLSAWLVIGPAAVLWLSVLGGLVVLSAAKVPLSLVLRRQGARPQRRRARGTCRAWTGR